MSRNRAEARARSPVDDGGRIPRGSASASACRECASLLSASKREELLAFPESVQRLARLAGVGRIQASGGEMIGIVSRLLRR